MRLFIALDLPPTVGVEIDAIRQRLQRSGTHPVKWVRSESIHLTLHFLGEVADDRAPAILAALAAVPVDPPVSLRLEPAGVFPNLRRPQVVWVGVGDHFGGLERLHAAVGAALVALGFTLDTRPFRAHLTLGRVRRDATPVQQADLGAAVRRLPPPRPITWSGGPPILFQSTLTPAGAVYRALRPE